MSKIPDAIRQVAVSWGDAHHWFIEDKVKMAQDILEATDKLLSLQVKQKIVSFQEWIRSKGLYQDEEYNYWKSKHPKRFTMEAKSTEELYEIFLSTL